MKRRGFTLIELLVVVLIIGILSAIALPKYQTAVMKARYTQAMTLANSIYRAEQAYYMANGRFAYSLKDLDIDLPAGEWDSDGRGVTYSWGRCFLQEEKAEGQGYGEASCLMKGNVLYYLITLSTGARRCRYYPARDTDGVAAKVCASLSSDKQETSFGTIDHKLK